MANLCLECLNKLSNDTLTFNDVEISFKHESCENCGEVRPIVINVIKYKRENRKGWVTAISAFVLIYTGIYYITSCKWYIAIPLSIINIGCSVGLIYYHLMKR